MVVAIAGLIWLTMNDADDFGFALSLLGPTLALSLVPAHLMLADRATGARLVMLAGFAILVVAAVALFAEISAYEYNADLLIESSYSGGAVALVIALSANRSREGSFTAPILAVLLPAVAAVTLYWIVEGDAFSNDTEFGLMEMFGASALIALAAGMRWARTGTTERLALIGATALGTMAAITGISYPLGEDYWFESGLLASRFGFGVLVVGLADLAFGQTVAARMPLLRGASVLLVTLGIVAIVRSFTDDDPFVGVDYSGYELLHASHAIAAGAVLLAATSEARPLPGLERPPDLTTQVPDQSATAPNPAQR